jgi:hypothetical protein
MGTDGMDDILQPQHSSGGGDQPSLAFRIFELDRRYATKFIKFPVQFRKISQIAISKVEKSGNVIERSGSCANRNNYLCPGFHSQLFSFLSIIS